jgi:hypothetical protein
VSDYVVQQEDGVSKIELEDGSGFILLEQQPSGTARRITQVPVEAVVRPTDAKARITQAPVEVVLQNTEETVNWILVDWEVRGS